MLLNILLVIIGVFLVVLAIYLVPKWQTKKTKGIADDKKWQAENEFRKTLIQVFGGLVVILSLLFTWAEMTQSQRNLEKGQHITRFSQAISFLGANNSDQKIGGIYTLEQIAKESPEEYLGTVIEVLSAFVRNAEVDEIIEEAKKPGEKKEVVIKDSYKIKPETQIALTVLGRIRTEDNKKYWEKLPRINLENAKLMFANLSGADLTGVYLTYADLTGANLMGADLTGANLAVANLTKAFLREANLESAFLAVANLTGADLMGADLTGAYLMEAEGLKVEQLLEAKTLFNVSELSPEMKKELKEKNPKLFKEPK